MRNGQNQTVENIGITDQMDISDESKEESDFLASSEREKTRLIQAASKQRKCLLMISCMMQQLICNGIGYGLSVMYAELVIVFDAKRSEVALIQSIYMAIATGGGIFFTGAIKKIGHGNSMIIGGVVGCIGLFASSFSEGLSVIIVCTGVVASIGMSICYLAAFVSVGLVFLINAGFFLVTLSLGPSLGQFIVPVFYDVFIEGYSWSGAFILMAGIALQTVPFGVIVNNSKQYIVTGINDQSSPARVWSICDMSALKDPLILMLLLNFHLLAVTGNFESWFLVDLMISRGFSRQSGSALISALGFANVIGRVLGAVIRFNCINIPTVFHWVYLCPIIAVGHALIININDYWGLFAICILYGIPFGAFASQVATIIFETTSLDRYPQTMAIANLVLGTANVYSGQVGGYVRDTLGEYDLAFYVAAGVSLYITVTTFVVACFVKKRVHRGNYSSKISLTV